ncbi:hypothetical protein ACA30_08270 [Virgibacillus soli]|nr:hypothetical protein ACA30_08270 [Virgibacillus soli]
MYPQLLTYLLEFIKYQDQMVRTLQTLLIATVLVKLHMVGSPTEFIHFQSKPKLFAIPSMMLPY